MFFKLLIRVLCLFVAGNLIGSAYVPPGGSSPIQASSRISATEAIALGPKVLWVDARGQPFYLKGHVPGAIDLNEGVWSERFPELVKAYTTNRVIVVYCFPQCDESKIVAIKIQSMGYKPVLVLSSGYPAWENARRSY